MLHAEVYNTILRHHHVRQKQLQTSIAFLQELSLFRQLNISSLTVQHKDYHKHEVLAISGSHINHLMIIVSGEVQVTKCQCLGNSKEIKTTVPLSKKVIINTLGKGKVIGQSELFKDSHYFEYTNEVSSSLVEVMTIPVSAYTEAMKSIHFKKDSFESDHHHTISYCSDDMKRAMVTDRTDSAYDLIKNLIQLKSSNELVLQLPSIYQHDHECQSSGHKAKTPIQHAATPSIGNATTSAAEPTRRQSIHKQEKWNKYSFLFVDPDNANMSFFSKVFKSLLSLSLAIMQIVIFISCINELIIVSSLITITTIVHNT
jgi:CRP-like cAMP-binding protein